MRIEYSEAPVSAETVELIRDLTAAHYSELYDRMINLDVDAYVALGQQGMYRVFVATVDGDVVGYCCMLLTPDAKEKGTIDATQDAWFLDSEHRGGTIGIRLLKFVETKMAEAGAKKITQLCTDEAVVGAMYERLGYEKSEVTFVKRLDGE